MEIVHPKVSLLAYTPDPNRVIATAARTCYSDKDFASLLGEVDLRDHATIVDFVIMRGHLSVVEHVSFTFMIEGVSRALSHQLVRHRIASYSQQSQRYVKYDNINIIMPPAINRSERLKPRFLDLMGKIEEFYKDAVAEGVNAEDARFALPNATETKIVVTMNGRELMHALGERQCTKAQWEIRDLAGSMLEAGKTTGCRVFDYVAPKCQRMGFCPEKDPCGMFEKKWKKK